MGVPPETPTVPFAPYPVAPALVTAAADDTFATAAPLREAGQAAVRSAIAADIETEGILQGLIGALGNQAAVPFTECTEAAVLCAGAVTRWSEAIGTFISGVDGLQRGVRRRQRHLVRGRRVHSRARRHRSGDRPRRAAARRPGE